MEPKDSLLHSQVPDTEAFLANDTNRILFLRRGVVSTSPNPQAGGPPLVGYLRLLIQYIRSYPLYCWPFFHPQIEDAPCRCYRDPLITHGYIQ